MESHGVSVSDPNPISPLVLFNNKMLALCVEREGLKLQLDAAKGSSWDIQPLISAASQTVFKLNQLLSIFLRDFYFPLKWSRLHKEKERMEILEHVQKWHRQFQEHVDYLLEFSHPTQVQEMLNAVKKALLYNSMVTNVQPPRVMEQATHVDTSVRVLHDNEEQKRTGTGNEKGQPSLFRIFILNEAEALKLFQNWQAGNSISNSNLNLNLIQPTVLLNLEESQNILSSRRGAARQDSNSKLKTYFDGLKVNNSEMNSTDHPLERKFCLLYLKTVVVDGVAMETWCISLPFVLMTSQTQSCSAHVTIFWDDYFKKVGIWLPFQVEEETTWAELSFALIDYFKVQTETEWNLTPQNLKYIGKKVFKTERFHDNSIVDRKEFCQVKDKVMTNWRWLFSIVELIKTHLAPFWNSGAIVGFIDRLEAENLIRSKEKGTFLIRFSDNSAGSVSYTFAITPTPNDTQKGYKSGAESCRPLSYSADGGIGDLNVLSLDERIIQSPVFTDVLYFEPTDNFNYQEVLEPKEEKFTRPPAQGEEKEAIETPNPNAIVEKTTYSPPVVFVLETDNPSSGQLQPQPRTDAKLEERAENERGEKKGGNDSNFVSSENASTSATVNSGRQSPNRNQNQNPNPNPTEWKSQEYLFKNVELMDKCAELEEELKKCFQ